MINNDANNATPDENINVIDGLIFHKKPAIKLDGSAIKPVSVWYVPIATPFNFALERSAT